MIEFSKKLLIGISLLFPQQLLAQHNPIKPNIIVFFIDDMGSVDLPCYGYNNFYKTPNIDLLAKVGVRFSEAYSASTVCSPSRAALMTGKSPARLHLTDWIQGHKKPFAKLLVPDWTMYLDLNEKTLPESLKELNYQTWQVGKWHLGDEEKYFPENHGFDVNIAGNAKGQPNKSKTSNGYFSPYALARISDGPVGEYLTDRLTKDASELIKNRDRSKPFYLNLAHYAVHTPLMGKPEKVKAYQDILEGPNPQKNPVYAAMIESVDESVANVMKTLENENLIDNTLIIFAADNGTLMSSSQSKPFREGKGWAYEGGTRTPLLMYWKGKIEGGKVIDEPAITMDIYATIMDAVDAKKPKDIDGESLLPVIASDKKLRRALYWHYPHYHEDKPHGSVRYQNFKLIQYFEDNHYELYNLAQDEGETKNLEASNPQQFKKLKKKMESWRKKVGAQMPTINPKYDAAKANKSAAQAEH